MVKNPPEPATNVDAFEQWLTDFGPAASKRARTVIEVARSLARETDNAEGVGFCTTCKRGSTSAQTALAYLKALESVAAMLADEGADDGQEDLERDLSAAVGNAPKPRARKSRAGSGGSGGGDRSTADAVAGTGRKRRPRAN